MCRNSELLVVRFPKRMWEMWFCDLTSFENTLEKVLFWHLCDLKLLKLNTHSWHQHSPFLTLSASCTCSSVKCSISTSSKASLNPDVFCSLGMGWGKVSREICSHRFHNTHTLFQTLSILKTRREKISE